MINCGNQESILQVIMIVGLIILAEKKFVQEFRKTWEWKKKFHYNSNTNIPEFTSVWEEVFQL